MWSVSGRGEQSAPPQAWKLYNSHLSIHSRQVFVEKRGLARRLQRIIMSCVPEGNIDAIKMF